MVSYPQKPLIFGREDVREMWKTSILVYTNISCVQAVQKGAWG